MPSPLMQTHLKQFSYLRSICHLRFVQSVEPETQSHNVCTNKATCSCSVGAVMRFMQHTSRSG